MSAKWITGLAAFAMALCIGLAGCDKKTESESSGDGTEAATPVRQTSDGGEADSVGGTSADDATANGDTTADDGTSSDDPGDMMTRSNDPVPPAMSGGEDDPNVDSDPDPGVSGEEQSATPDEDPNVDTKTKTAWHVAKVGDTLKYKAMGGTMMVWKVTKVDDESVTVEQSVAVAGQTMPAQTQTHPRYAAVVEGQGQATMPANAELKKLPDETVTVAGRELTCEVRQSTISTAGRTIKSTTWTCDQVPGGLVKSETDATGSMQTSMELVEFTSGG